MKISHLALGAAMLAAASPALANTEAMTADADGAERTIIVTGQRAANEAEERAAKTPGGTDVVTYDEYADKSLVSLRDALALSTGVYLQPRY
ncbi:MAG: ligand-gated channel protein, partial [Pseudomonadota bacterium]|nr:ligand-gated channel protein [Pseudomonadota bacterium]